jgi:hypothetical protein
MDRVISLLLEIVQLVEHEEGAWAADVKTNCCMVMHDILSRNYKLSSFVVGGDAEQDFTSTCFIVFKLVQSADCDPELARILSEKIEVLTSKILTLSLVRSEMSPMPCDVVSPESALRSLRGQLNL